MGTKRGRRELEKAGSGFSSQTFCPVYVPPTYGSENQAGIGGYGRVQDEDTGCHWQIRTTQDDTRGKGHERLVETNEKALVIRTAV